MALTIIPDYSIFTDMSITLQDVDRVARLAKLSFSSEEKEQLARELDQIVRFVEKLNELDTDEIEPLLHVVDSKSLLRSDQAEQQFSRTDALKNAPNTNGNYFSVPKVIG